MNKRIAITLLCVVVSVVLGVAVFGQEPTYEELRAENAKLKAERAEVIAALSVFCDRLDEMNEELVWQGEQIRSIAADVREMTRSTNQLIRDISYKQKPHSFVTRKNR